MSYRLECNSLPTHSWLYSAVDSTRNCSSTEFIYRHKWRVNDMIFWDNRGTMHYALSDYDFSMRRHMHRTTIAGDAPY